MNDQMNWQMVEKLPDGHRLFQRSDFREYWSADFRDSFALQYFTIADDDGAYPKDTDDGVLYLDFDRALVANQPQLIPLVDQAGKRTTTVSNMSTLLYLSAKFHWDIRDHQRDRTYRADMDLSGTYAAFPDANDSEPDAR